MKLVIAKAELQKGLGRIQAIVEKRNSMPILANAYLEATQNGGTARLHIAATDLEVGVRGSHEAQVSTPGSLTVSAKKLVEIVPELPDEALQLNRCPSVATMRIFPVSARTAFLEGPTVSEPPRPPPRY